MRLDKFIANNSSLSRKEAKRAAKAGEVLVNGQAEKDLSRHLTESDTVSVFGEEIETLKPIYLMYHKPENIVCATRDNEHITVIEALCEQAFNLGDKQLNPEALDNNPLQIVGRLDIDTTGLLLLTTDGQWNHRVSSPRQECAKVYQVTLAEPLTENAKRRLCEGVLLADSPKKTAPAQVEVITEQEIYLTIHEGRYHQVKRMLAAVGNQVTQLHRVKIGAVSLDNDLPVGEYRYLTEAEVASFY